MLSQPSASLSQQPGFPHYQPSTSSFLNDQFFLSAASLAASHSYPPPSSFLSTLASSNLLTPANTHMYSNSSDEKRKLSDYQASPIDVKNLIGSSLTALGLDNVNEDEFDKAATNEQNNELPVIDNDIDSFERSRTPATSNTSPTHLPTISSSSSPATNPITRPMNIPNSFTNQQFSHSSSAKSPFDAPNQLFNQPLESVHSY
jgi:hypothetical protein